MSFIQIILHLALGITALTIVFMVFMFLRILFLDGMSNGFINLGYAAIAVFICWGVGALISKFI